MRLNIVAKREAPVPPYDCELVEIDIEAIPFILSALWLRSQRYWWLTSEDQKYGRWLMNKEGGQLLMGCAMEITNRQDALYNMLDARLGGILRDVSGTGTSADPYVYDDPIPQVVDPIANLTPGMQYNSTQVLLAMRNLLNGTTSANFADNRNFRQILIDILNAIGAESDEASIALLQKIALALGAVL